MARSVQPIDHTLTGTITPGQSGPGSNGDLGVFFYDLQIFRIGAYQMQFSVVSRTPFFGGGHSYLSVGDTFKIF